MIGKIACARCTLVYHRIIMTLEQLSERMRSVYPGPLEYIRIHI